MPIPIPRKPKPKPPQLSEAKSEGEAVGRSVAHAAKRLPLRSIVSSVKAAAGDIGIPMDETTEQRAKRHYLAHSRRMGHIGNWEDLPKSQRIHWITLIREVSSDVLRSIK